MFQYRQVLVRLRAGDSEREIARARLMGRDKVAAFRALAARHGWLDAGAELPDDASLAAALGAVRRARSTVSSVEPHRAVVEHWLAGGVGGKAIHAALCREHGYTGSYSSVARMLVALRAAQPPEVTVRLSFEPGEAAQVDFGAGPVLVHPDGQPRRTWAFEVCHSWFNCFRKLLVRYEKLERSFVALNHIAAAIIAFRNVPITVNIIYG